MSAKRSRSGLLRCAVLRIYHLLKVTGRTRLSAKLFTISAAKRRLLYATRKIGICFLLRFTDQILHLFKTSRCSRFLSTSIGMILALTVGYIMHSVESIFLLET